MTGIVALLLAKNSKLTGAAVYQLLRNTTVHVDAGAQNLTVEGNAGLGSDLYRAHIQYAGTKPKVSLDRSTGSLEIFQNNDLGFFASRHFVLDLQINSAVAWSVSADTGATNDTLNLSTIKLGSVKLNAGASRTDVTLGRPTGVACGARALRCSSAAGRSRT